MQDSEDISPIDAHVLKALKDIMDEGYQNLICTFLEDSAGKIQRLREAIEKADATMLMAVAHSLRGTSCNMGALTLSKLSHQLEDAGRVAQWDEAEKLFVLVDAEFLRVCQFFNIT